MTERSAPDPVAVEKAARQWEGAPGCYGETSRLLLAAYREHVRPADPERVPDGYRLLVEDGIAVFRRPEPGECWLSVDGTAETHLLCSPDFFGGRRFILVPKRDDDERTRLAKALPSPAGLNDEQWQASAQRVREYWLAEADRLLAAGVRFPEAES